MGGCCVYAVCVGLCACMRVYTCTCLWMLWWFERDRPCRRHVLHFTSLSPLLLAPQWLPTPRFVAAARGGVRWPSYSLDSATMSVWPTRASLLEYEEALQHAAALEGVLQVCLVMRGPFLPLTVCRPWWPLESHVVKVIEVGMLCKRAVGIILPPSLPPSLRPSLPPSLPPLVPRPYLNPIAFPLFRHLVRRATLTRRGSALSQHWLP